MEFVHSKPARCQRDVPTPHLAVDVVYSWKRSPNMSITALQRFAGSPELAASMVGEILIAQCVRGHEAVARLYPAFLTDTGCREAQRNTLILIPGLRSRPWWTVSEVPLAAELESLWPQLQEELAAGIARMRLEPYHQVDSPFLDRDHWYAANLLIPGWSERPYAHLFPKLLRALAQTPELAEVVAVSRLEPGGHIAPHCGPWNVRLMIHLGISVPGACRIRVRRESRRWRVGGCLVFDDSFEHECWNTDTQTRTVVLLNIWHPDLTLVEREILTAISRIRGGVYWQDHSCGTDPARQQAGTLQRFERFIALAGPGDTTGVWPAPLAPPAGWRPITTAMCATDCLSWIQARG